MTVMKPLIDLLNSLIEAERAGVETANYLLKHYPVEELNEKYQQLKKDEAWSCAGLHQAILREGGKPSMETGAFASKVMDLDTLKEKLVLLNKGQTWVARKIDEALTFSLHPETEAFLIEMKNKHHTNIGEMEKYLLQN